MLNTFKTFIVAEDGAVTVDWVVLTAALVGLGLAVITVVSSGINNATNNIADGLDGADATASTLITRGSGG